MSCQSESNTNILHRKLRSQPLKAVAGCGKSLRLETGQVLLDASAGASVSVLGYGSIEVAQAISQQILDLACVYSGADLTSKTSEELAALLLHDRPGGLSKAFFVNSGSEAMDAAIKLATQYWHERQLPDKNIFIARKQSYHGNTIGALSVSGHSSRRSIYESFLSRRVHFVDPCFSYRLQRADEADEEYVERLGRQLEDVILQLGSHNVSSFIAETVSGTSLGCVTAVPGYFRMVRSICDRYDILLILDEVMCGMGKTGTMHAWEQEGITGPDIQTIGKALGAGFIPLSGVLLHERICKVLEQGSGSLSHSHTFQAHPTACAAALAVQKIIRREDLLKNVSQQGAVLQRLLRSEIGSLPLVADIRGRGLFWSIEFMLDPLKKIPFSPNSDVSGRVVLKARHLGLSILGNIGTTGETHVEHVMICPAYTVTTLELEHMVELLRQAILDVVVTPAFNSK